MATQHITISIKNTPELIKRLYKVINGKSDLCFYCGNPAHYLQVVVENEKHLLTRRICHSCEVARRKKSWLKKRT